MLFLHETHRVVGARQDDFEAAYREGWMPTLAQGDSARLLWYTDQNVLNCRRNLAVLNQWREKGMKLEHGRLLIDRYLSNVAPDAETLGKTFNLEVIAVLAFSPDGKRLASGSGSRFSRSAMSMGV